MTISFYKFLMVHYGYLIVIVYTDVSKMHSKEQILYVLKTGKDNVFTTTCICIILW